MVQNNTFRKLYAMQQHKILSLTVLRGLLYDEVFEPYINFRERAAEDGEYACSCFGNFIEKLYKKGAEQNFAEYICNAMLYDENAFSLCCAAGETPSAFLANAYVRDVKLILDYIAEKSYGQDEFYAVGSPAAMFDLKEGDDKFIAKLKKYYRKHGCGMFIDNRAFTYESGPEGELIPVENPSPVTLEELKGYEQEKAVINDNIVNFMRGLPYANMLLYGDMGTGKSSTIHAMLNKYWQNGLRLIELNKENMLDLPKVRQLTGKNPLKFIIFIDDLSLGEGDDKISGLKAMLEGSVSGNTANTMIVATSNRRHIIKENLSDRENSVHVSDSMQEQLSLSDRFGITVLFSSTNKAQYLEIVGALAADCGIEADEKLFALAERWALVKGGRSPRRAKQFVDIMYACKKRGTQPDF